MATCAVLNTSQIWGAINPSKKWGAAFGILIALLSKPRTLSCKEKLEGLRLIQNEGVREFRKPHALSPRTALRWTIREIPNIPEKMPTAVFLKDKARLGVLNATQARNLQEIAQLAEEAAARDSDRLARKHSRLAQKIRNRPPQTNTP